MTNIICPLCLTSGLFDIYEHHAWKNREFCLCPNCDLVFVPAHQQMTVDQEQARYETHNNSNFDEGYLRFLQPTLDWIVQQNQPSFKILDYGSGPNPVMTQILQKQGYHCDSYDLYFQKKKPAGEYDFIFLHEVFEHFRDPRSELSFIQTLLSNQAQVLIRIESRPVSKIEFSKWWYARDFTHVIFPSAKTWQWIAEKYEWTHLELSTHLQLFRKSINACL